MCDFGKRIYNWQKSNPEGKYMHQCKTKEIADLIGIHVNTVRFYEEQGFISTPQRAENGYRIFTKRHVEEFKLDRAAFKSELLQNNLRKTAIEIVKTTALGNYSEAEELTYCYLKQLKIDKIAAEEALEITKKARKSKYVKEQSGGQQQRLFIVLALIPNPKVVFLDELTTGLDVKSRRLVWRSSNDLKNKGLTIFFTFHFMDDEELAYE